MIVKPSLKSLPIGDVTLAPEASTVHPTAIADTADMRRPTMQQKKRRYEQMAKMKEIMKDNEESGDEIKMPQEKRRKMEEVKPTKKLEKEIINKADGSFDDNNRYMSGSEAEYKFGDDG